MTTKTVVVGATGRTGGLVVEVAREDEDYEYVGGVASEGNRDGDDIVGPEDARALFEGADAVVDFSTPEATKRAAQLAGETETALVTGTTALDEAAENIDELKNEADPLKVIPASAINKDNINYLKQQLRQQLESVTIANT